MADDSGKYEEGWNRLRELETESTAICGFAVGDVRRDTDRARRDQSRLRDVENGQTGDRALSVVAAVSRLGADTAQRRSYRAFRCPRCGNRFYGPPLSSLTPGRTCGHSGLLAYQAKD